MDQQRHQQRPLHVHALAQPAPPDPSSARRRLCRRALLGSSGQDRISSGRILVVPLGAALMMPLRCGTNGGGPVHIASRVADLSRAESSNRTCGMGGANASP